LDFWSLFLVAVSGRWWIDRQMSFVSNAWQILKSLSQVRRYIFLCIMEYMANVVYNTFVMLHTPSHLAYSHFVIWLNLLVIISTVVISSPQGALEQQFDEGGFITYFSVIQLFVIAYMAYRVFKQRSKDYAVEYATASETARSRTRNMQSIPTKTNIKPNINPWKSQIAIWAIISFGFAFLALDDLWMIHERLDMAIHRVLQWEETGVSDRLDDLIVGLYGIVAIALLAIYRHELKRYKAVLPQVIAGFAILFVMVGIDVLANRDDIFLMLLSAEATEGIMSWIFVLEEGCKLLSEGFFMIAIYCCWQMAKRAHVERLYALQTSDRESAATVR